MLKILVFLDVSGHSGNFIFWRPPPPHDWLLAKKFAFCKVCSGSHKRHNEEGETQCYQAFLVFLNVAGQCLHLCRHIHDKYKHGFIIPKPHTHRGPLTTDNCTHTKLLYQDPIKPTVCSRLQDIYLHRPLQTGYPYPCELDIHVAPLHMTHSTIPRHVLEETVLMVFSDFALAEIHQNRRYFRNNLIYVSFFCCSDLPLWKSYLPTQSKAMPSGSAVWLAPGPISTIKSCSLLCCPDSGFRSVGIVALQKESNNHLCIYFFFQNPNRQRFLLTARSSAEFERL